MKINQKINFYTFALITLYCISLEKTLEAKEKKPGNAAVDALFDTPLEKSSMTLEDSIKSVKPKDKDSGLKIIASKKNEISFHEAVKVRTAEKISKNSANECIPSGPRKKWIMTYFVEGFPAISQEFGVCLDIFATQAHDVSIHVEVLDSDYKRVANAESFMHLSGQKTSQLVIRFKELHLKSGGQYYYKVEINREKEKILPLVMIKGLN